MSWWDEIVGRVKGSPPVPDAERLEHLEKAVGALEERLELRKRELELQKKLVAARIELKKLDQLLGVAKRNTGVIVGVGIVCFFFLLLLVRSC